MQKVIGETCSHGNMHVILLRRTYERLCRIWKAIFHCISFEHIEPHMIRKYGLIMHTLEWNSVSNSLGKLWTIHQCIGITLWHKLLKLFLTFSHPFMAVQSIRQHHSQLTNGLPSSLPAMGQEETTFLPTKQCLCDCFRRSALGGLD